MTIGDLSDLRLSRFLDFDAYRVIRFALTEDILIKQFE
jgi:hypothetical protein